MNQLYFSASDRGFYDDSIHDVPAAAIKISADLHADLLSGQSEGKRIMPPDDAHDLPWLDDSPTMTLGEAKVFKMAEINTEKDRRISAGVSFGGALYDSDDKAQIRVTGALMQLSLAASAGQTPPPVNWVAMDDSVHALDMTGLIGLGQAISGRLSACVLAANTHKIALDGLADAKAIAAYDISKGWPL